MIVTMLKKLLSASLAVALSMAVTTSAYASENILDSISAGAAKQLVSPDTDSLSEATIKAMEPVEKEEEPVINAGSGSGVMKIVSVGKADDIESGNASLSETEDVQAAGEEEDPAVNAKGDEAPESVSEETGGLCVADVDDIMNVRAEASEEGKVLGYLYKDCVGEILESADGWTKIRSGKLEGWAKNDYMIFGEEAEKKTEGATRDIAIINADALRIRSEASEDAEVKAMLSEGDEVELIDLEGDDWAKISFEDGTSGEDTGYVSSEYISIKTVYKSGETIEEIKDREEKSKAAKEESDKKKKESKSGGNEESSSSDSNSKPSVTNNGSVSASVDDETLLAALIQCECNGPYDAQLAVGAVVVNRARSGYGSISGAIYAPGQFGPASSGKLAATISTGAISASSRQAARDALSGVSNVGNAKYFRNVKSGHAGIVIGNHVYW